jgi:hypothetical protein
VAFDQAQSCALPTHGLTPGAAASLAGARRPQHRLAASCFKPQRNSVQSRALNFILSGEGQGSGEERSERDSYPGQAPRIAWSFFDSVITETTY